MNQRELVVSLSLSSVGVRFTEWPGPEGCALRTRCMCRLRHFLTCAPPPHPRRVHVKTQNNVFDAEAAAYFYRRCQELRVPLIVVSRHAAYKVGGYLVKGPGHSETNPPTALSRIGVNGGLKGEDPNARLRLRSIGVRVERSMHPSESHWR